MPTEAGGRALACRLLHHCRGPPSNLPALFNGTMELQASMGLLGAEGDCGMLSLLVPSPQSEAVTHELEELTLQPKVKLPPLNERKNGKPTSPPGQWFPLQCRRRASSNVHSPRLCSNTTARVLASIVLFTIASRRREPASRTLSSEASWSVEKMLSGRAAMGSFTSNAVVQKSSEALPA